MLVADLSFGDVYAIRSRTTALIDAQAPNEERRGPRMRLAIVLMLYRRKKLGVVMVRLAVNCTKPHAWRTTTAERYVQALARASAGRMRALPKRRPSHSSADCLRGSPHTNRSDDRPPLCGNGGQFSYMRHNEEGRFPSIEGTLHSNCKSRKPIRRICASPPTY